MAGKGAVLAVRIVSDASKASQGFDQAQGRLDKFESGLNKVTPAAAGVVAGVAAIGTQAFNSASELQQAAGAVEAVFGDMADKVQAASKTAAQQYGLSASAFDNAAALMGSQLQNMGFSATDAWDSTQSLLGLGSDLAAQFGGSTQDAVEALSSALKGERDPIEKYAVSLSQAAIDSKVAALGLDTSTDASKRNAQAQATLALITEQTASAHGAFGREADTAAGQQQRATASWENASAQLGQVLLPIVSSVAEKLAALAGWVTQNSAVVGPFIGIIGGLAAGVLILNGAMKAYSVVQGIVNAVVNASPLMRLIMIITGIVAVVILMYQKFAWFRDLVSIIGGVFSAVFGAIKSVISWVVDKIMWVWNKMKAVGDFVGGLFGSAAVGVPVVPVAAGSAAGMFGAAGGGPALFGASLTPGAGGGSTAGSGSAPAQVIVNVTIPGLVVDPVATGRALERVLRDYASATGRSVALTMGQGS